MDISSVGAITLGSTTAAVTTVSVCAVAASSSSTTFTSDFSTLALQNTNGTNGSFSRLGFRDNTSDSINCGIYGVYVDTTNHYGDLAFITRSAGGLGEKVRILSKGGMIIGTAALGTTATDGFLYIPTCAGAPTGVPTTQTGTVAMIYDTTNNKLYIYNGAWKGGTTPGAWT